MFGWMQIYTVHVMPDDIGVRQKPIFVKEGFNQFAFVLTLFWAIYHRLWVPAILMISFDILLMVLMHTHIFAPATVGIIQIAYHIFIGLHGNDWIRNGLQDRGYVLTDISAADSLLRAEQRYFERYLGQAA